MAKVHDIVFDAEYLVLGLGYVDLGRRLPLPWKFSLADYRGFLTDNDDGIAAFRQQQAVAFAAERPACDLAGEFRRAS